MLLSVILLLSIMFLYHDLILGENIEGTHVNLTCEPIKCVVLMHSCLVVLKL